MKSRQAPNTVWFTSYSTPYTVFNDELDSNHRACNVIAHTLDKDFNYDYVILSFAIVRSMDILDFEDMLYDEYKDYDTVKFIFDAFTDNNVEVSIRNTDEGITKHSLFTGVLALQALTYCEDNETQYEGFRNIMNKLEPNF